LQLFLKANIGVDYVDFYNLLHVTTSRRLPRFTPVHEPHLAPATDDAGGCSDFDSTDHHLVYDLFRLEKVLAQMTEPVVLDVLDVGSARMLSSPACLHAEVRRAVSEACKSLGCCCGASTAFPEAAPS